jgi:hypothetical protein
MFALGEFQQRFAHAVLHPDDVTGREFGIGLRVYQNTVVTGLLDVLRANYPTVARLVGDEWFADVGRLYLRAHLPEQAPLALYGKEFSEFVAGIDSAAELSYLPHVAQLDRLWTEAHFAADATALQAGALTNLSTSQLAGLKLQLHPTVRLAWLPHSAVTIWLVQRQSPEITSSLAVSGNDDGALLVRHNGTVQTLLLDAAEHELVWRLQHDESLGEAAVAALQKRADVDLTSLLAKLIHAGVFQSSISFEDHL